MHMGDELLGCGNDSGLASRYEMGTVDPVDGVVLLFVGNDAVSIECGVLRSRAASGNKLEVGFHN